MAADQSAAVFCDPIVPPTIAVRKAMVAMDLMRNAHAVGVAPWRLAVGQSMVALTFVLAVGRPLVLFFFWLRSCG